MQWLANIKDWLGQILTQPFSQAFFDMNDYHYYDYDSFIDEDDYNNYVMDAERPHNIVVKEMEDEDAS